MAEARPALLYRSDTGERYPPTTSYSSLMFWRTWSTAISNMRRCMWVMGEKEPHATRTSGVFAGSVRVRERRCEGKW